MKKILIIQTAFIGDVILATSLIEAIKKEFPNSQLDFLLRSGNETLIETSPHINKIYIWNKKSGKYLSLFKNIFAIRKEQYDLVLNIQRFFNSGLVTVLSGAKKTIGFDKNPLSFFFSEKIEHKIPHITNNGFLHEVERNMQLAHSFIQKPYARKELKPNIYFNETDIKVVQEINQDKHYVVLAPASVWFTKQWDKEKWIELIKLIPPPIKIFLIGAPSDNAFVSELFEQNNKQVTNLCGKLSLRQSALLMKDADRVFVNDSAPLHLASSVNAKTTAIFCSTIPEFGYGPLADDSKLIQLDPRLECMPCGLHGKTACPLGHFRCAKKIDIETVLATIDITIGT